MADWIYVDNSNLWIGGKSVSAVAKGDAKSLADANMKCILDNDWRMDFGELYRLLTEENPSNVARAMFYGSSPPDDDTIWKLAEECGFEVVVEKRNVAGKEKKIDTGIVTEIMYDALSSASEGDMFTIVSGDADFVPAVKKLVAAGKTVDVAYWSNASKELKEAATEFRNLDGDLERLSR